jgi:hypothetical protein
VARGDADRGVAIRPGGQRDRARREQVTAGVGADQPADARRGQQDAAERAADQPDGSAADRVQRAGAAQQRAGAHDGRDPGLPGGRAQHDAAVLGDQRGVEHPVPAGGQARQHERHRGRTGQGGADHQPAAVAAVGDDPGGRAEEQDRQVFRGEGQAGGPERAGDQENVRRDGQDQQPRAEIADQVAGPQQAEIPDPQRLEHDRHPRG